MAYVITSPCIDVKDGACQVGCPVECIYEGGRMMYIHPDECIDCGLCLSLCPVQAIYVDDEVPEAEKAFIAANAEYFGAAVTGLGSPGGWGPKTTTDQDHPTVSERPRAE